MDQNRKSEVKVGVTVTAAAILLVWVIAWAQNVSFGEDRLRVEVLFPNVAGLEIGDPVAVNGVRKGYVDDVEVRRTGVIVALSMEPDVELRADAEFYINMLDLMGGKRVDVKPGLAEASLDYSETATGVFNADIPAVMAMAGWLGEELPPLMARLNLTLENVNELLDDQETREDLKLAVENLAVASSRMNAMLAENRENARAMIEQGAELTRSANETLAANRDEIETALAQTNETLEATNRLIAKLDGMVEETTARENNAGRLLYDETLVEDLRQSLRSLKEVSKLLNEQLEGDGIKVDAYVF
jgi:phospholipid/cholesterol/gamma-HCH transport system substrate-binding protein